MSGARIFAALVGVATLVQGIGSISQAYQVFKAALAAHGIMLP